MVLAASRLITFDIIRCVPDIRSEDRLINALMPGVESIGIIIMTIKVCTISEVVSHSELLEVNYILSAV